MNSLRLRLSGNVEESILPPSPRISSSFTFLLSILALLLCWSCNGGEGQNAGKADQDRTAVHDSSDNDIRDKNLPHVELLVGGAASLKEAFEEIGRRFTERHPEITITFSFAGSNVIVRQAEQDAPFDVIALAEASLMDGLVRNRAVRPESVVKFARNRLCLALPYRSGDIPTTLEQITGPYYTRIAIASPGVPARIYAEESLRKAGLFDRLQSRFVFGANVRQVLAYIESGEVDCGFVYQTDAMLSENVRIAFVIDSTLHNPIRYPAAVSSQAVHPNEAVIFLQYLTGNTAGEIMRKYGFE